MAQSTSSDHPTTSSSGSSPSSSASTAKPAPVSYDDLKDAATALAAETATLCDLVLTRGHLLPEKDMEALYKEIKETTSEAHEALHPLQELAGPAEAPPTHQPS